MILVLNCYRRSIDLTIWSFIDLIWKFHHLHSLFFIYNIRVRFHQCQFHPSKDSLQPFSCEFPALTFFIYHASYDLSRCLNNWISLGCKGYRVPFHPNIGMDVNLPLLQLPFILRMTCALICVSLGWNDWFVLICRVVEDKFWGRRLITICWFIFVSSCLLSLDQTYLIAILLILLNPMVTVVLYIGLRLSSCYPFWKVLQLINFW